LSSRHQNYPSPAVAAPAVDADIVTHGIHHERSTAELVEGEKSGTRSGADHRERRFLYFADIREGQESLRLIQKSVVKRGLGNEVGCNGGADFAGCCRVTRNGIIQIIDDVTRPVVEIVWRKRRRPSAPEQRAATDAVGQPVKRLVADPGHTPDYVLRPRCIIALSPRFRASDTAAKALRQILDVGLQKKGPGVEQEDPQGRTAAMPVKLLGAVAAEHPGANDDGIEGIGSRLLRGCYFLPIVANVAGDNVVAKIGLLNIVPGGVGRCYELIERHDDLRERL